MIELKITSDKEEPVVRRFESSPIRIGREEDNDLVLRSRACSRHHAEIVQEGGTYKIKDLGSANGIRLGTKTLTEAILKDGCTLEIGEHTLTVSLEEEPEEKTVLLATIETPSAAGKAEPAPEKEPPVIYLVYRQKDQVRSLKVVSGVEYVIGRAPDADLIIEDPKSSAHHALVFSKQGRFRIRDTKSSNGTRVNGQTIDETDLQIGDQIGIGNTVVMALAERDDLTDEGAILERTQFGVPNLRYDSGLAKDGDEIERSKKSVGVGAGVALAAVVLALVGLGAYVVLRGFTGERGEGVEREVSGTGNDSSGAAGEGLIVQVATVGAKDLVRAVEGTGTVSPHRTVTVSAEVAGRIVAMPVEEGSTVESGQILARINETDIRLQIDEARSAVSQDRVELAKEEFERQQRLFDDGVATRSMLDQAKNRYLSLDSAYKSTQAKVRQLEEQLGKTRIVAPMSGRVAKRFLNQGEFAVPGAPLVTLENMDNVKLELELSDRDIVKVEVGQVVEARTDAFSDRVFRGVVDNVASTAHPVTRTFKVEAHIENQDGSLRSGMIVSLKIILESSRGLVVPEDALMNRRGDEADVFVVREGRARKTKVLLGEPLDREVEAVEGLSEGDEVIVYGKEQVSDGQVIDSYQQQ